jgi:hypothetical protein
MAADYELFKGTTLSDLFKKINHNSDRNKIQIESLIQELMTYIKDPNSAIQLFPMISDYMEANIRNDELLVKLAAVVQRVIQTEFKTTEGEYGLSDAEKEQIINKLEDATRDLQKEVDDLNFEIK